MEGLRYSLHSLAVWMALILASGKMRRRSRMSERRGQSHFFEIGLECKDFGRELTVVFEG